MRDIIVAIFFVLALNTVLFMGEQAIIKINPGNELNYFDYTGSNMEAYDTGNYSLRSAESTDLPTAQSSVSNDGNFFTDIFSTIKNWILDATGIGSGLKYFLGVINTVPNFLKALGLPPQISFALGYLWHTLTFFIFIAWLKSG